jgi:hypothetical protein
VELPPLRGVALVIVLDLTFEGFLLVAVPFKVTS